jgi:hypothetical protein
LSRRRSRALVMSVIDELDGLLKSVVHAAASFARVRLCDCRTSNVREVESVQCTSRSLESDRDRDGGNDT